MLSTGCRPTEAAWLVLKNSFKKHTLRGSDYAAVVPAEVTKTKERYKWQLKKDVNVAVELVALLH